MSGWIAAADADRHVEHLVRVSSGDVRAVFREAGDWEWRDSDGAQVAWVYPGTPLLAIPCLGGALPQGTSVDAEPTGTDRWILTLSGRHFAIGTEHLTHQDLTVLAGLLARAFADGHEVEETEPGRWGRGFLVLGACEPGLSVGRVRHARGVANEGPEVEPCSRCGHEVTGLVSESTGAALCATCYLAMRPGPESPETRRWEGFIHDCGDRPPVDQDPAPEEPLECSGCAEVIQDGSPVYADADGLDLCHECCDGAGEETIEERIDRRIGRPWKSGRRFRDGIDPRALPCGACGVEFSILDVEPPAWDDGSAIRLNFPKCGTHQCLVTVTVQEEEEGRDPSTRDDGEYGDPVRAGFTDACAAVEAAVASVTSEHRGVDGSVRIGLTVSAAGEIVATVAHPLGAEILPMSQRALVDQMAKGVKTYGAPLRVWSPNRPKRDLKQELVDALHYATQDEAREKIWRAEAEEDAARLDVVAACLVRRNGDPFDRNPDPTEEEDAAIVADGERNAHGDGLIAEVRTLAARMRARWGL